MLRKLLFYLYHIREFRFQYFRFIKEFLLIGKTDYFDDGNVNKHFIILFPQTADIVDFLLHFSYLEI